jgi:type IV pilus assembly protein PilY1
VGGQVIANIGSSDAAIKAALDAPSFNPVGATPIAETLAEAGLYFAGEDSWANHNLTYTSPIQWRCQKNYVILMTDGNSWWDEGNNHNDPNIFTRPDYMNGKTIGDYDNDGVDPHTDINGGTHWLDDVAKFLHDEDLMIAPRTDNAGESFDDITWPKQSITTYTIGFATGTDDILLTRAADSSHGHGAYYSSENSTQLQMAFTTIIGQILETNASFIAPVVPVSKLNQTYAGNSVYLSLFKPNNGSGFWYGNVKKFGLNPYGYLLQKNGSFATNADGLILDSATSCWQESLNDGSTAEEGGAGAALLTQSSRNNYTYKSGNPTALTHSSNLIGSLNGLITYTVMGLENLLEYLDLLAYLKGEGIYDQGGDEERDWMLGDILHSRPATMYDGNKTVIFVGANDGFLHVFVDDDKGTVSNLADDTVNEAWTFTPWELLPTLKELKDSTTHHYYVDGSPVLYKDGTNRYVTFGLRRGGNKYYTLDIGDYDANGDYISSGYLSPKWAWEIAPNILTNETLGQSWSTPVIRTIAIGSGNTKQVILLSGGYDADNEDLDNPASNDTKGRAIFAVDAATGALNSHINFNHSNFSDLDYSVVDLTSFDYNGNGLEDTIYAGSLGGDLFAFEDRDADGEWEEKLIFQARYGATASSLLKFFYSPDITLEGFGDYVFIGTGDREHPTQTTTVNRFYAIKNRWPTSATTFTEADLIDVTSYSYGPETYANITNGNGWYIRLNECAGETVVSSPIVINGIVFFTTFCPSSSGAETDECYVQGLGGGYLYAMNYLTGEAVINFDTTNDANGVEVLAKSDRRLALGGSIPSEPTMIVTPEGTKLIIGTAGPGGGVGAVTIDVPESNSVKRYYWQQN